MRLFHLYILCRRGYRGPGATRRLEEVVEKGAENMEGREAERICSRGVRVENMEEAQLTAVKALATRLELGLR